MITEPSYIPININKLKNFIYKKYKIDIHIDGEFIEEVLSEKYDYHVYKKGKKKDTIEFKKNNKKKINNQNENNISLKELKFNNFIKIKTEKSINNEVENITDKIKKIDIDDKKYSDTNINKIQYNNIEKEIPIYNEYKNVVNQFNYVNINYEHLKNCYYYLIEKHKNTYNFFISLTMGLQKIYNEIRSFKVDNNIIRIKEIEHKKILYNIEKIIPKKELILNLNF